MSIDNYTDRERELRCAVADLQAENKALQDMLAQQAAMVEKCMVAMNENADRGERAEAELAVCKADAKRLDFMIKNRVYVVSDESCCDDYWLHYARPDGTTWVQASEHETPRAAIDAAMKGDQP